MSVQTCYLDREIENLVNLRHPCISTPIGFEYSSQFGVLKIVRLYAGCGSLSDLVSLSPEWWISTAKAVVGLVLGLRFGHSLGLLHGHLTTGNVLFNEERVIQITDFYVNRSAERDWNSDKNVDVGGFSEEDWTPTADVRAFAEVLFLIAVGVSDGKSELSQSVPTFVSEIIEIGLFAGTRTEESMMNIFNTLPQNAFKVVDGVDSDEVSALANWAELSERETE